MSAEPFRPGPLAAVDSRAVGERWTLVFVRDLAHPPERVWAALTDAGQLGQWSPFTADRDLDTVGDATLTMIDADTTDDSPATVHRAEPPVLLEYTWGTVAAGWHLCLVVAERLLAGQPIPAIRGRDAMRYGWPELHEQYARRLVVRGTGWPE